jgi:hypothetical protein
MNRFFILITTVLFITGCAGMGGDTGGTTGSAGSGKFVNHPSSTYFGA